MRSGEVVRHTFGVVNPYDFPLTIIRGTPSCSCTTTSKFPLLIKPRDRVEIPVEVKLRGGANPFRTSVALTFDRGKPIMLSVRGTVTSDVPEAWDFGRVRRGAAPPVQFRVNAVDGGKIAIKSVEVNDRYFRTQSESSDLNSGGMVVTLQLKGDAPFGPISGNLKITTDDRARPVKTIRLRGYILKPLDIEPSPLIFGVMRPGEPKRAVLRVLAPYGGRVSIRRIDFEPDSGLSCESSTFVQEGDRIEIPIALAPPATTTRGIVSGTLRLSASLDDRLEELGVDYYAMRLGEPGPVELSN